jgi:hypothetical protein
MYITTAAEPLQRVCALTGEVFVQYKVHFVFVPCSSSQFVCCVDALQTKGGERTGGDLEQQQQLHAQVLQVMSGALFWPGGLHASEPLRAVLTVCATRSAQVRWLCACLSSSDTHTASREWRRHA